jgi:hypothetical protein
MDELRAIVSSLVVDVQALKMDMALTKQGQEDYQARVLDWIRRQDEGLKLQDKHLMEQDAKLNRLLSNDEQWAGARKLFALAWGGLIGTAAIIAAWANWISAHASIKPPS